MEPLVVEFEVAAPVDHAFRVWTAKPSVWWPPSHTMSGGTGVEVVFEPHAGGRIYERGPDGTEHEWGEVTEWNPPGRVSYLWHLFFERAEATEVVVSFADSPGGTLVRIEQTGFEKLGEARGAQRRDRTEGAWGSIAHEFLQAF